MNVVRLAKYLIRQETIYNTKTEISANEFHYQDASPA